MAFDFHATGLSATALRASGETSFKTAPYVAGSRAEGEDQIMKV